MSLSPSPARGKRDRGLFPPAAFAGWANLATSAVAAAGFLGVVLAGGHPRIALTMLCAATGLDRLDGLLARRLGQVSAFGAQLDSLADALAFCALPAMLAHVLGARGPLGAAPALLFVICGLWRLAYFNVHGLETGAQGGRYTGMPTTIAASWFLVAAPALARLPGPVTTALITVLGLLMVSRLPYPKDGLPTKVLYLLVPCATVLVWLGGV